MHSTYQEVAIMNTPAINSLPDNQGILVLKLILIDILDFVGAEWNSKQITKVAEICYEGFGDFCFSDIKLFINKTYNSTFGITKENPHGAIYGKFTPMILIQWLKEFKEYINREKVYLFNINPKNYNNYTEYEKECKRLGITPEPYEP